MVARGFAFANAPLKGETVEIRLEPGATWRGKVTDEAGTPVAGAKVSVRSAMKKGDWESRRDLQGEKNEAAYQTQTGADGAFAVADAPADLGLEWSVEHPDFTLKRGNEAPANAAFSTQLAPGGSLRGRVLGLDGKPLAGVMVYGSVGRYGGGNDGKTDAKGEYLIKSLAAGTYSVGAYLVERKSQGFVLPRVKDVAVEIGKIAEAPDIRAVVGVEIKGLVRDATSKKPLEGASLNAQMGNDGGGFGVTDAAGRFTLRVLPGRYKIYVAGPPEGYARVEGQQEVVAGEAAPAEVVFDLKPAALLTGTVVDEAGRPIQTKILIDHSASLESDAGGKWEFASQNDRALQLGGGDAEAGYYEIVSPRTIPVDTVGPITITLRLKPWQVLPGRALDSDGKPLQGVEIAGEFYTDQGDGNSSLQTSQRAATSNPNGDFILPRIRDGIRANSNYFKVSGKKAGYAFKGGGILSKNGPVWQISDLVFTPLNLEIAGQTTPGARVTAAGREAVAGADGKFVLKELPGGIGQIHAQLGEQFGVARAQNGALIELKPQGVQERDPELARDIWNDLLLEAGRGTGARDFSISDIERRIAGLDDPGFAAQFARAKGDGNLSRLIDRWAGRADFAVLEPAFAAIKSPDWRLHSLLSAATRSDDPRLGARALQEAQTSFAAPAKEGWWHEMNLYLAAPTAAKWGGEAAGFAALDRAIAYTLKHHPPKSTRVNNMPGTTGQNEMMALVAENVARGGLPLVRRLMEQIDPETDYRARVLGESIPVLAEKFGPETTLPLFDELEKMPPATVKDEGHSFTPERAFAVAAVKVVPLLGAKSPEKALALARRITGDSYGDGSQWQALSSAAQFQTGEAAAKGWREIVSGAQAIAAARYAARAWEFDPILGRELFQIARQKADEEAKNDWNGPQTLAAFAFYSARMSAAPVRYELERLWGAARQKQTEGDQLGALALAMVAIDGPRAWQMARDIPADNSNSSLETRRKIGVFLAAKEERRRDFPFDRSNWEEWRALEEE